MAFRQVQFGGSVAAASIVHRHRRAAPCPPPQSPSRSAGASLTLTRRGIGMCVSLLPPSACNEAGRPPPTYLYQSTFRPCWHGSLPACPPVVPPLPLSPSFFLVAMWQQSPPVNQSRSRWRGGNISPYPPLPFPLPPCTLAHDCSERGRAKIQGLKVRCEPLAPTRRALHGIPSLSDYRLARPQVFAPSACPPAAEIACRGRLPDARCAIPSAGYSPHRLTPPSLSGIILRTCRCSIMSAQKERRLANVISREETL